MASLCPLNALSLSSNIDKNDDKIILNGDFLIYRILAFGFNSFIAPTDKSVSNLKITKIKNKKTTRKYVVILPSAICYALLR